MNHDMTEEERDVQRKLRTYKNRKGRKKKVKVEYRKIHIDGKMYMVIIMKKKME